MIPTNHVTSSVHSSLCTSIHTPIHTDVQFSVNESTFLILSDLKNNPGSERTSLYSGDRSTDLLTVGQQHRPLGHRVGLVHCAVIIMKCIFFYFIYSLVLCSARSRSVLTAWSEVRSRPQIDVGETSQSERDGI